MGEDNKFDKITDRGEVADLLNFLDSKRPDIFCQFSNGKKLMLHCVEVTSDQKLVIKGGKDLRLNPDPKIFINFMSDSAVYFSKTKMSVNKDGHGVVSLREEIYKLQRRSNFRSDVPANYDIVAEITHINDDRIRATAKVKNVSLGGCLLELSTTKAKIAINQKLEGHISKKGTVNIQFMGEVRHCFEKIDRDPVNIFGVQFSHVSPGGKASLNSIIMELYRESFSKYSR